MSDRPRLLLCSFDVLPAPTGTSRRVLQYLRALSQRFSVVVLSIKTPELTHIEKLHGARLLRVPVGSGGVGSRLRAFGRAVRRQLESEEYLVAHFTDPFVGTLLCEMRDTHDYRLVYDAQTFFSSELAWIHPELAAEENSVARVRRSELFCLMNADRVLCGSEVTRTFIHSLGVARHQVQVLRAPLEIDAIPSTTPPPTSAGRLRVVYVGSDAPWQGLPSLLSAIAVASRDADVRLAVIGPARRDAHEPQLRTLGLDERVSFQAPVSSAQLATLVAGGDLTALPLADVDRNRGPGGPCSKVADYLAAGRGVLASDLPLAREFLPSDAASFHSPGDVDAMAAALVQLAWDPRRCRRMGAAAREAAVAHDAANIHFQLLEVYDEVVSTAAATHEAEAPVLPASAAPRAPGSSAHLRSERADPAAPAASRAHENLRRRRTDAPASVEETSPSARTPTGVAPLPSVIAQSDGAAIVDLSRAQTYSALRAVDADEPTVPAHQVHEAPLALPSPGVGSEQEAAPSARLQAQNHTGAGEPAPGDEVAEGGARLDPWFAQAVHGYCPPDANLFARSIAPTNFPGRSRPAPAPSFTRRTTDS